MRGKKSKWAKGGFASHARPQNDPARFHETGSPINHIGRTRRRPLWPSSAVLNWQIHSLWSAAAPARKKRGGEQPLAGRFAGRELAGVVEYPADRRALQSGADLVLLRPLDRPLRRVDVGHLRAGRGSEQRCDTRIGEQVEKTRRLGLAGRERVEHPLP